MAVVTSGANILVIVDVSVMAIGVALVVRVTQDAFERREISRYNMAVGTVVPSALVRTGIDREELTVVIPVGRIPRAGAMAILAGSRKVCCRMIRIGSGLIITLVTGIALRRGSGVPARMASEALKRLVCSRQRKPGLAVVKGRGIPGVGVVALGAIK